MKNEMGWGELRAASILVLGMLLVYSFMVRACDADVERARISHENTTRQVREIQRTIRVHEEQETRRTVIRCNLGDCYGVDQD